MDGKKSRFSAPPEYTVKIGNEKFPYMWKPDSTDTFTINNSGEYKTIFVDDNMTFGVQTISGPYMFENC